MENLDFVSRLSLHDQAEINRFKAYLRACSDEDKAMQYILAVSAETETALQFFRWWNKEFPEGTV